MNGVNVTVSFEIPAMKSGSYASISLVVKKNGVPMDATDGDVYTLSSSQTSYKVEWLDELSHYFFVIFSEDDQGNMAVSEPADCMTDENLIPPEWLPYIEEINGKVFAKKQDETIVIDNTIGGTIFGANTIYGQQFLNPNGFRYEASTNRFGAIVLPYCTVNIDYNENNENYVVTCNDFVGQHGEQDIDYNYFECIASTQKPFGVQAQYKLGNNYIINSSLSPIVTVQSSVIGCLNEIKNYFAYADIYLNGNPLSIVSH